MLEIVNLSIFVDDKQQSYKIVDQINISINHGEIFSLIGESGSGKTMTALSLLRLLPQNMFFGKESKIIFQQQDLLNISENQMQRIRGANISMIFQDPMTSLNPVFTIGSQILEVLKIHRGLTGNAAHTETFRLLDAVEIVDSTQRFNSYPHELSGGMRQRAMIAMALACKPNLLIADEPTTALDVTTQKQILVLLKRLQQSENMSMLLITHNLRIAAKMSDQIAVMQNGKIVEQNKSSNFFKAPQHDYSQKLLNGADLSTKCLTNNHAIPILDINNLKVYFAIKRGLFRRTIGIIKAVDNIAFSLFQGQTLAIVGESGSGKSTLAKAVLGLIHNAEGNVEYNKQNLLQMNKADWALIRADLQMVFQDPYSSLNPKMRIIDILEDGMIVQGKLTAKERQLKVDALLKQVGLDIDYKWRYPHEFSGGERQRICIARALSVDPKIIICDEATSSLDVTTQAQILNLLLDLQANHKLSYLLITHDFKVVSKMAHKVAVMYRGQIVEYGDTKDILDNPQNSYTKELLDSSI